MLLSKPEKDSGTSFSGGPATERLRRPEEVNLDEGRHGDRRSHRAFLDRLATEVTLARKRRGFFYAAINVVLPLMLEVAPPSGGMAEQQLTDGGGRA